MVAVSREVLVAAQAQTGTYVRRCHHAWRQGGVSSVRSVVVHDVCSVAGTLFVKTRDAAKDGWTRALTGRMWEMLSSLNPHLTQSQRTLLRALLEKSINQLLWHRKVEHGVVRGIIALSCPTEDTADLFNRVLDALLTFCDRRLPDPLGPALLSGPSTSGAVLMHKVSAGVARAPRCSEFFGVGAVHVWRAGTAQLSPADVELIARFRADPSAVAALREGGSEAVLAALMGPGDVCADDASCEDDDSCVGGADEAAPSHEPEELSLVPQGFAYSVGHCMPICSITLEPLLNDDGHLLEETVVVLQRDERGMLHAYLFRRAALLEWLRICPVPTNPATRTVVHVTDIYRLR